MFLSLFLRQAVGVLSALGFQYVKAEVISESYKVWSCEFCFLWLQCMLLEEHLYLSNEFTNIVCSDPKDKSKLFAW